MLDAGCGTGRYAVELVQAGAHLLGIDSSEGMLKLARERLPSVAFQRCDLQESLPFPDATFDKVCCAQVLKHLSCLDVTLSEFARVLRDAGTLVFSVTHPDMNWDGYELRTQPDFILSREADIHHYGWADYESALRSTGFVRIARRDVQISESIAHLLTPSAYSRVLGRPQVLVCVCQKAG